MHTRSGRNYVPLIGRRLPSRRSLSVDTLAPEYEVAQPDAQDIPEHQEQNKVSPYHHQVSAPDLPGLLPWEGDNAIDGTADDAAESDAAMSDATNTNTAKSDAAKCDESDAAMSDAAESDATQSNAAQGDAAYDEASEDDVLSWNSRTQTPIIPSGNVGYSTFYEPNLSLSDILTLSNNDFRWIA